MRITVIGTGYVGLVTGVSLAYLGNHVTCIDKNNEKIEKLKNGIMPIYEPCLEELFALSKHNLTFTSDYSQAIPATEILFIAVCTPSLPDGSADMSYLKETVREIGETLTGEDLIIVTKSTVPVGSGSLIESMIYDALIDRKHIEKKGNIYVVSNPEFLKEGAAVYDTLYPSRIVIGSNHPAAIDKLTELYKPIIRHSFCKCSFLTAPDIPEEIPVVTCGLSTAELIKYAANAFLALKISFINEIASLSEKVDADIIKIAAALGLDSRIGKEFLRAGIGWGGSCFGKDTSALIACAKEYKLDMNIIEAAVKVNYSLRDRVIEKLQEELKILKGKTVSILGLSFKPDTDDLRDSPSVDIAKKLALRGVKVRVHDPVALQGLSSELAALGISGVNTLEEMFPGADAVILATEWPQYKEIPWQRYANGMTRKILLDGRNFYDKRYLEGVGFKYLGVGR